MNIIDKVISVVAPSWSVRRMKSRYLEHVYQEGIRKYDAATKKIRGGGYNPAKTGPNTDIATQGNILVSRSRDMTRNNPYAWRASRVVPANVVNGGIKIAIKHSSMETANAAKEIWKEWADEVICDFDEDLNFAGIQRLITRSVRESGEVFVRQRRVKEGIGLQLQILESDFLDTGRDGEKLSNGNEIIQGIEFNSQGKKVAYWLFEQHPSDNRLWTNLNSIRVPAKQILHIFYKLRPGQIRGIPFGPAAMLKLKDFDEYEDANLIRQKIAACFSVFVTDTEDPRPGEISDQSDFPIERVEPGIIEHMGPNKEITLAQPPTVDNYGEYSSSIMQGVAAGYDLSYEQLTNDYSKVNFSSGRMGWLENDKLISEFQNEVIINQLCKPVFKWFVTAAFLKGKVDSDIKATWTAPKRQMLDPLKESKGTKEMVGGHLYSWQGAVRDLGRNPDEVFEEIVEDHQRFAEAGIPMDMSVKPSVERDDDDDTSSNN